MMRKTEILKVLDALGFEKGARKVKAIPYSLRGVQVYIKGEAEKNPLVIHPDNKVRAGEFDHIQGLIPTWKRTHNDGFGEFPKKMNRGKVPTNYGYDFGFETETALREFISVLIGEGRSQLDIDLDDIDASDVSETEKYALRKARVGQGRFRRDLMTAFDGVCPLTGIGRGDLLRASHIKPWRDSTNVERLDASNGLLFAANVDALFDRGYISFDDTGGMLVAEGFGVEELHALGLRRDMRIVFDCAKRRAYMEYHRLHVFASERDL